MSLGPVMIDVAGTELTTEDRELLAHPVVGGVILFARNFTGPEQVAALNESIHSLRDPRLLIAVDQEGGRVQRFREGFTRLPAAGRYREVHERSARTGRRFCELLGWLMASELRAVGVDFSFAPVLDLDRGISQIIGDRAFGERVDVVTELALAWMHGVRDAGMASVGKHFPGHGGVSADSHTELPRDDRRLEDLLMEDLIPFQRLIDRGLEAIMPAHVVYSRVDTNAAGFSAFWLRDVLRGRMGFQGVIFSDDMDMAAAAAGGDYVERANAALAAGCDELLVCNNRPAAVQVIEALGTAGDPTAQLRLLRMHGRYAAGIVQTHEDPRWPEAIAALERLEAGESLDLALDDPTTRGYTG